VEEEGEMGAVVTGREAPADAVAARACLSACVCVCVCLCVSVFVFVCVCVCVLRFVVIRCEGGDIDRGVRGNPDFQDQDRWKPRQSEKS